MDPCEGLNTLTEAEKAEGWELLFDGKTLNGWHGYNGGATDPWSVDDCAIHTEGTDENYGSDKRVDMTTDSEYTSFEFVVDWKATPRGNSGLMYSVVEDEKYETAWATGPEYQFQDDAGMPEPPEDVTSTGSDYDMLAPNDQREVKPVGEWNTTKLVVNGPHVEHWLNGEKVVVLVDGRRWTHASGGGIDLAEVDPDRVERVDVLRGAASAPRSRWYSR